MFASFFMLPESRIGLRSEETSIIFLVFPFYLFRFLKYEYSCGTVSCTWWRFLCLHFHFVFIALLILDFMKRSGNLNLNFDVLLLILYILNGHGFIYLVFFYIYYKCEYSKLQRSAKFYLDMKLSIKCGYITNHCELLQSLNIITAWEITVCKGKDIIWCLLLQFEFHLIQKQSYESSQITISCYINWKGQQCMYITELGRNFYVAKFLCAMHMFNHSVILCLVVSFGK